MINSKVPIICPCTYSTQGKETGIQATNEWVCVLQERQKLLKSERGPSFLFREYSSYRKISFIKTYSNLINQSFHLHSKKVANYINNILD